MSIPLMRSTFLEEQTTKDALCQFIQGATKLSMGEQVAAFETEFARWQGRRHCIMVNSGSSANLVLIQALLNMGHLQPGDHVGVSAVTWATNVMPLIQLGLIPRLVDVDLFTLNVCDVPTDIRCMFLTHLLGFSSNMNVIQETCRKHGILLLEDTCESLGCSYETTRLGNFGHAATFSTFVGHHMSTIEGGMIVTDDDALADMLRMVRAHGWDRNVSVEKRDQLRATYRVSSFYGPYTFYTLGYNVRPTDLQGFLGREQLKHVDAANARRQLSYAYIRRRLASCPDIQLPDQDTAAFAIPIICKDETTRERYINACGLRNIEIRPIVAGHIGRQPFFSLPCDACPNADRIHTCGFYMPNHPDLTVEEQNDLCSIFGV